MNEFFRRIHYLINRRRFDRELAADMEVHRELAARAGGNLGNPLRLREEAREAWGWMWIDRLAQDLKYAARMLRRSPGFTLAAILTLAIGIGVNVAAFSFFDKAILTPLPVANPESIMRFQRVAPHSFASDLPYPEMAFIRDNAKTLSAVLAQNDTQLAVDGEPKHLNARFVAPNFFTQLGATATLGRTLNDTEDADPTREPVVVLGYSFWVRHFGSSPNVVGKAVRLNGRATTIVGVVSEKFSGLRASGSDLWLPLASQPMFIAGSTLLTDFSSADSVQMWGRIRTGLSAKAAEEETRALLAILRKSHPAEIWENERLFTEPGAYVTSPHGHSAGDAPQDNDETRPIMGAVGALTLLILAVACGNLGSLLLARGAARHREMAIRTSVGAGNGRLVRQLLTESLLLALLGSLAGLGLGYVVLRALLTLGDTPVWFNAAPDARVVFFAIAVGFLAAILFGLSPALQLARRRQNAGIMRTLLIGAQVAGSCILLIVSGLLLRALDRAMFAYPGFEYEQVVSLNPSLATHGYTPQQARAYMEALKSRLSGSPGIDSVSFASVPPLGGTIVTTGIEIAGRQVAIHTNRVEPEFFRTMRIPMLRGRIFQAGDTKAIVIGESLARIQWPGEDPLGKIFKIDGARKYTVVGVAGSARIVDRQDADGVEAYFPATPADMLSMFMLVRTSGPPEGLLPFLVSTARALDTKLFPDVQMLKSSFANKLEGPRYSTMAVGLLGFVALLLACSGIVGLVSYAVSQRTKEIGLRMALGAKPPHVLALVLLQVSRPVVIGLLSGIGGAAALSQILRRQLYGVSSLDPIAYLTAVCIFGVAVAVAAVMPARRALRVDPMKALRCD